MVASLPWGIFFCFLMRIGNLIYRLKVLWGLALVFSAKKMTESRDTTLQLPNINPKTGTHKMLLIQDKKEDDALMWSLQ